MTILFDKFHLPDDIYEVIFSTEQQIVVAKLLVGNIKENDNVFSREKMGAFSMRLHNGFKKVKYNKRQFYDRIVTPMKSMGLLYYDLYHKTYSLSDDFNKQILKIGLMWLKEVRKNDRSK